MRFCLAVTILVVATTILVTQDWSSVWVRRQEWALEQQLLREEELLLDPLLLTHDLRRATPQQPVALYHMHTSPLTTEEYASVQLRLPTRAVRQSKVRQVEQAYFHHEVYRVSSYTPTGTPCDTLGDSAIPVSTTSTASTDGSSSSSSSSSKSHRQRNSSIVTITDMVTDTAIVVCQNNVVIAASFHLFFDLPSLSVTTVDLTTTSSLSLPANEDSPSSSSLRPAALETKTSNDDAATTTSENETNVSKMVLVVKQDRDDSVYVLPASTSSSITLLEKHHSVVPPPGTPCSALTAISAQPLQGALPHFPANLWMVPAQSIVVACHEGVIAGRVLVG